MTPRSTSTPGFDPESLHGLPWIWTGARARRALGEPRSHGGDELIVAASLETLQARCPAAVLEGPDTLVLGATRLHASPGGLEAGLGRRLVRLDALGVDAQGAVLDPFGGREALSARSLVALPAQDEASNALLGVRVAALASELAVAPSAEVEAQIAEAPGLVLRAERHALRRSLTQLLVGRRPAEALALLERTRLLGMVLPEVAALVGLHRTSRHHHKDVWAHTCLVVRQAIPDATIRWAALLHDIGKPYTRTYEEPRTVHFFHHDVLGAVMFEGVAARLRFPAAEADRIRALILHHLRANLYVRTWTDAAVRRFSAEMGPVFTDLLHLSRADVTSKRPGRRREAMATLYDLRVRTQALARADAERRPQVPKGLGEAIIRRLGVAPGPEVGELRRLCEAAVRRGDLPETPAIDACIEFLRSRGAA